MGDIPGNGGLGGLGWLGVAIGISSTGGGIATALGSAFHGSSTGGTNLFASPPTFVATGGLGLYLYAHQSPLRTGGSERVLLGTAAALMIGGVAGLVASTVPTFRDPGAPFGSSGSNDAAGGAIELPRTAPTTIGDLAGIDVASANVLKTTGADSDYGVYLDTAHAVAATGTTLAQDVVQARAAAQADPKNRSEAVVQLRDGSVRIAPLSGTFAAVDGEHYTDGGNGFDQSRPPTLTRSDPSLLAVVGTRAVYDDWGTSTIGPSEPAPATTPSSTPTPVTKDGH